MENVRGIALMILAMATFTSFDALVKYTATGLPTGLVILTYSVLASLVFFALTKTKGEAIFSKNARHPAVIGRCVLELLTSMTVVIAVTRIDLSVLAAVLQATPITMTLGAVILFGEKVGWRRWSMILLGFTGILIIVRPFGADFDANVLIAFVAMLFQAMRDLLSRRVPQTIGNLQLATLGTMATLPSGFILLALNGSPETLDLTLIWSIPVLLVLGTVGYLCITASVRLGDVSVVLPFRYTRLIFAIAIGMVFFAERPDLWTWIGATLVVGSGLYTLYREMQVSRAVRHDN